MKTLFTWVIALGMLISVSFVHAEQATTPEPSPYEEMYKDIIMPEKIYGDDIVEVTEIFLYTCPHCFRIHPFAEKWKKTIEGQKDVVFNPMPAVFSEKNTPLAKAFYIAKDLGKEELHKALFEAIHSKGRRITTKDQVKAFFVEQGVDDKAFDNSYKSFAVDNSVRTANFVTASYGISGVPSLVVNGKYLILSSKTKGYNEMFKVVDYLIEKERKLIAKKKAATEEKVKPAE
ncbi:thiol:disulfide interchange protein DsbA/DsbL [Candidatus Albibeggiatoa sp. nov. BB20]|uniref:thiol:disulfide interchange protein DsbA/DsbL n=1 Tax=Candidatus Albibeggiatoa sp. nov. BB20 TaxID=3162723 RepID=UPI0033656E57